MIHIYFNSKKKILCFLSSIILKWDKVMPSNMSHISEIIMQSYSKVDQSIQQQGVM